MNNIIKLNIKIIKCLYTILKTKSYRGPLVAYVAFKIYVQYAFTVL